MSISDLLANPQADLLVETLLKGAVLLALAWGLAYLLREKSAALRHGIWTAAFAGLLVLPLVAFTNVNWTVEAPVGPVPAWEQVVSAQSDADSVSTPDGDTQEPASPASESEASREPAAATIPNQPTESSSDSSLSVWSSLAGLIPGWSAGDWILFVWSLGALVEFVRLAYGFGKLHLWRRRARALAMPKWTESLDRACRTLDIDTDLRLLTHSQVSVPMTWGIGQAALLLPEEARSWSEEEIEVVLLHELGHIKRRDYMTHLMAEVARALHWPDPLAWLGTSRLITEREKACDDLVVRAGVRPSRYAEQLLSAVDRARELGPSRLAAPAMARPSKMADRIRAICAAGRDRRHLGAEGWSGVAGLVLGFVVIAGTFGGCQPSSSQVNYPVGEVLPRESDIPTNEEVDAVLSREAGSEPEAITAIRDALENPTTLLETWKLGSSPDAAPVQIADAEITPEGRVYLIDRQYQQLRLYQPEAGFVGQVRSFQDSTLVRSYAKYLEWRSPDRLLIGNRVRGVTVTSVTDQTAAVQGRFETPGPEGGMCMIGDRLYIQRAHYNDLEDGKGVIQKVTLEGEVKRSFGAWFDAENDFVSASLSGGFVGCHKPSGTVLLGYNSLPLIRAYSTDGKLKWTARLRDFRPYRIKIKESEDGDPSANHSVDRNKTVDRVRGFHVLSDQHALLQVQRISRYDGGGLRESETHSYVLSVEDGSGHYLGSDIPLLYDLDGSMAAIASEVPSSQLSIARFSDLRGAR